MSITTQSVAATRKKRNRTITDLQRTTICDLPEHTISDILTRVPAWTVACTLTLCRTIQSSVSNDHDHFSKTHFSRSSKTLSLLYPPKFDLITGGSMHLLDDHINGGRISAKKSTVGIFSSENFPIGAVEVKGSCNGLILCLRKKYAKLDDGFFVCNPIMIRSKWVKLPRPSFYSFYESDCGLGFCSETGLYKVVRIVSVMGPDRVFTTACEVLIVGSDHWRAVPFGGSARFSIHHNLNRASPLVEFNGSLHGLFRTDRVQNGVDLFVSRFKIREEELSSLALVPVPVREGDRYSVTLGVLSDQLVVFIAAKYGSGIEIWGMVDYGVKETWAKRWVLGSGMLKGMQAMWLKPIKVREDGELLMWYMDQSGFYLVCYHPERSKFRRHKLHGIENELCERIDYTPSFLSPRDVVRGGR